MALVSSQNNMKKEATAGTIMALRVRQLRIRSTDTTVTEFGPTRLVLKPALAVLLREKNTVDSS